MDLVIKTADGKRIGVHRLIVLRVAGFFRELLDACAENEVRFCLTTSCVMCTESRWRFPRVLARQQPLRSRTSHHSRLTNPPGAGDGARNVRCVQGAPAGPDLRPSRADPARGGAAGTWGGGTPCRASFAQMQGLVQHENPPSCLVAQRIALKQCNPVLCRPARQHGGRSGSHSNALAHILLTCTRLCCRCSSWPTSTKRPA